MMKKVFLYSIYLAFLSCSKISKQEFKIDGLWIVKEVKMGENSKTPIARWMRFNSDSSQTSGNGWLQHSIGTWKINTKNEISVTNANGLLDEFGPFKVRFNKGKMIWNRFEEGHPVEVHLERIQNIPTSNANKLYGLWKIDSIIEGEKNITDDLNPDKNAMLFLRWDNTYELRNYPKGKKYGIFKTHAHREQLDMVSYSKVPEFQFFKYEIINNNLILSSTSNDKEIRLTRIHQFLQ